MSSGIDPGFLRSSDLFENQPDEVLQAVLVQGQVEDYGPGAIVFRQGDQGNRLYIVKSGVLEILAAQAEAVARVAVLQRLVADGNESLRLQRARADHGDVAVRVRALARE